MLRRNRLDHEVMLTRFSHQESLAAAFNAANQYAETFEQHRVFYRENENTDLVAIKEKEHGEL